MIDYFALALGHGLMAIALLRLVMRQDLDADPLLDRLKADMAANRKAASAAGRQTARRSKSGKTDAPPENAGAVASVRAHDQAAQR